MIIAEHLTKRYRNHTALHDMSFHIRAGEAVALWGANGAGKTTTLRCILGVHSFEGSLAVNGVDVRKQGKAARAAIGYVPQEAAFYDMTVVETLHFYARLKRSAADRIDAVLEQVRLVPHSAKRVSALSGGMKQRLALAVALLSDPPVLVLDEPTANLDVSAQRDFLHAIQSLNQAGKTIVFSSHRLDEVLALGSRVLVLDEGRLTLDCPPQGLAPRLGLHRWLRIWVPAQDKTHAVDTLSEHGYKFLLNGHSVYVQVGAGGKVAPLRLLESAQVVVDDFDVIDGELVFQESDHD